jgi:hypothetical protein
MTNIDDHGLELGKIAETLEALACARSQSQYTGLQLSELCKVSLQALYNKQFIT